jgi:hypothetical protein
VRYLSKTAVKRLLPQPDRIRHLNSEREYLARSGSLHRVSRSGVAPEDDRRGGDEGEQHENASRPERPFRRLARSDPGSSNAETGAKFLKLWIPQSLSK